MRLRGERRQNVYSAFLSTYADMVGPLTFRADQNERKKVRDLFNYVAEAMGIRDEERFDEVLVMFRGYLRDSIAAWKSWGPSSRSNVFGFLVKKEEIGAYVASEQARAVEEESVGAEIAGTAGEDRWDF